MLKNTLPSLVGILNITPDSFSDGGKYNSISLALTQAERLITEGATVIDIGAESTRPGALPLNHDQEWLRIQPVLAALATSIKSQGIKLSMDTYHPETAAKALAYGVDWINDVSGGMDPLIQGLIAESGAKIVMMHNLGVPSDLGVTIPEENDPVKEVKHWAEARITELMVSGIRREQIIFDPGIGFGKTAMQSLALIKNIKEFCDLGVEIMVGHSRKSFFKLITKLDASERDIETYVGSIYLSLQGVNFLRVHDVLGNYRAIRSALWLFE